MKNIFITLEKRSVGAGLRINVGKIKQVRIGIKEEEEKQVELVEEFWYLSSILIAKTDINLDITRGIWKAEQAFGMNEKLNPGRNVISVCMRVKPGGS